MYGRNWASKHLGMSGRQEIQFTFKSDDIHSSQYHPHTVPFNLNICMCDRFHPGIWQSNLINLTGNLITSFIYKDIITLILLSFMST